MSQASQVRTYDPSASVVFLKTNERFGGLSNMAPGFPLQVNSVRIRTSEALYQACRFPHMPDVQRKIIDEHSPMTAKMRSKPFRKDSRPDWDAVRVKIMRWCLRVKLAQNWREFGRLLLATGDRPIVEQSRKDDFWGAKVAEDGSLVGINVLGRLLMELREQLKGDEAESLNAVEPLSIPEFLLFQKPIGAICADEDSIRPVGVETRPAPAAASLPPREVPQPSLFDQPAIARGQMDNQSNRAVEATSNKNPTPYSGYRDSAHNWLGAAPEHWKVVRSKYLFREVDDRTDTGTETLLSMRQAHGLIPHAKVSTKPVTLEDLKGYKRVQAGQMVVNRMQASNGMFAVAREDGLVSPDYAVFRLLQLIEPDYFVHLFKTNIYRAKFRQESKGLGTGMSGFLRLYSDRFGTIPVPQPPADEQRKIVDFIRSYDLRVRRLIRNKRRLIGLLNEQKQAIINQAVTRGLNPDAPMKPTGVDWMPEVPAHWEVKRLKTLVRNVTEQTKSLRDGDTYIALEHVKSWTGEITPPSDDIAFDSQVKRFHAGDVLFGKLRPYLAKVTRPEQSGVCVGEFLVLRPTEEPTSGAFLEQKLRSKTLIDIVNSSTFGAKMPRAGWGFIGNLRIAFPSDPDEQNEILNFIRSETSTLSQAIIRTEQEIALISEFRERLTADVVTGKLDVRHTEISAPTEDPAVDNVEDPEELEEELETDDADVMEGSDGDD